MRHHAHQSVIHSICHTHNCTADSSSKVNQLVRGFFASQAASGSTAAKPSPAAAAPAALGVAAAGSSRPQQPPHPRTAAVQKAHAAAGTTSGAAAIAARLEASRSAAAAQMPAPGGVHYHCMSTRILLRMEPGGRACWHPCGRGTLVTNNMLRRRGAARV